MVVGASRAQRPILVAHVTVMVVGAALLAAHLWRVAAGRAPALQRAGRDRAPAAAMRRGDAQGKALPPARACLRGGRRVGRERSRGPGVARRPSRGAPGRRRGAVRPQRNGCRVAPRAPHRQPDGAARDHAGGRGRARQPLLPVVGEHQRRRHHSGRLLPDQRGVRALPQGHLRAVEAVGPPLFVFQQPVVPQVDRVHAGRRRHRAVQVVRRLPRPRRVLQRALRPARSGSRSTRRRRRRAWAAPPATPSSTSAARWARATS